MNFVLWWVWVAKIILQTIKQFTHCSSSTTLSCTIKWRAFRQGFILFHLCKRLIEPWSDLSHHFLCLLGLEILVFLPPTPLQNQVFMSSKCVGDTGPPLDHGCFCRACLSTKSLETRLFLVCNSETCCNSSSSNSFCMFPALFLIFALDGTQIDCLCFNFFC